jgi:hypothetical protein
MVNIRFSLTIFEEGAGNISVSLQSCITSNKHVHFISKSCKLRKLHGMNINNFILLLCCQCGLNVTQQCRSLESPSYSLPARDKSYHMENTVTVCVSG